MQRSPQSMLCYTRLLVLRSPSTVTAKRFANVSSHVRTLMDHGQSHPTTPVTSPLPQKPICSQDPWRLHQNTSSAASLLLCKVRWRCCQSAHIHSCISRHVWSLPVESSTGANCRADSHALLGWLPSTSIASPPGLVAV